MSTVGNFSPNRASDVAQASAFTGAGQRFISQQTNSLSKKKYPSKLMELVYLVGRTIGADGIIHVFP